MTRKKGLRTNKIRGMLAKMQLIIIDIRTSYPISWTV